MRISTFLSAGLIGLVSSCIFVAGNTSDPEQAGTLKTVRADGFKRASADLDAKSASDVEGHATFTEVKAGTIVELVIEKAPPGWHAVHVHEVGDCSATDGSSAGGHFNPAGAAHGSPHAPEHHAGDLGNVWVDASGRGHHVILMPDLTVTAGPNSVTGRALIVHAGPDDLTSQPTGAAGGRIACGEIH